MTRSVSLLPESCVPGFCVPQFNILFHINPSFVFRSKPLTPTLILFHLKSLPFLHIAYIFNGGLTSFDHWLYCTVRFYVLSLPLMFFSLFRCSFLLRLSSRVSVEITMATKPQGDQGRPRFGPSDRLIAMFRLALQSGSVTNTVVVLFVWNIRVTASAGHFNKARDRERAASPSDHCSVTAQNWVFVLTLNIRPIGKRLSE